MMEVLRCRKVGPFSLLTIALIFVFSIFKPHPDPTADPASDCSSGGLIAGLFLLGVVTGAVIACCVVGVLNKRAKQ